MGKSDFLYFQLDNSPWVFGLRLSLNDCLPAKSVLTVGQEQEERMIREERITCIYFCIDEQFIHPELFWWIRNSQCNDYKHEIDYPTPHSKYTIFFQ